MAITKVDLANVVTGVLPVANGGTGTSTGVAPGGSTTQVQYNNAGAFGGSANFVFDGTNVGIGTSSPAKKLDVVGTMGITDTITSTKGNQVFYSNPTTGTNANYIQLSNTGGGFYVGNEDSAGTIISGVAYSKFLWGTGAYPMVFATNGSERMRIDSSGNVGIGTTTPTAFAGFSPILDLKGTAPAIAFHDTTASAINFTIAANSNQMDFYNDSTSTSLMTLLSGGNVGIGTSSPASDGKLSVESNGSASSEINISLINGISNKECIVNFGNNLATAGRYKGRIYYQVDNNVMGFWTNTTERMRLDSSGNLLFNSGYGSVATAYGCRAWVNFNGTGTVAIRASGNVSSITDNGTGNFTVNFSTALVDASYTISGMSGGAGSSGYVKPTENTSTTMLTTYCTIRTVSNTGGSDVDQPYTLITIVR